MQGPRHSPTVGSWGEAFSYERDTPAGPALVRSGWDAELPQLAECPRDLIPASIPEEYDSCLGNWSR